MIKMKLHCMDISQGYTPKAGQSKITFGEILVDLDYNEDSKANVDANFIFSKNLGIAEVQVSGEESTFKADDLSKMIKMSEEAVKKIFQIQEKVLS